MHVSVTALLMLFCLALKGHIDDFKNSSGFLLYLIDIVIYVIK